MPFNKINMKTWPRAQVFSHIIKDVKCVICINAQIDVTALVLGCREQRYRFYPAFIYAVSSVLNQHEEFKMGYDENGVAGFWDGIDPSYIVFHAQDALFTRIVSAYTPDFESFYSTIIHDIQLYDDKRGFEIPFKNKNTFDASCLPFIHYNAIDLHIFDSGIYLAPVVTWGKYQNSNGRIVMPLTMQIHHAAADGFHIARFFAEAQQHSDGIGDYLQNKKNTINRRD